MSYGYLPIQSPYIFDNLPLFVIIYCIWLFLLLILLTSVERYNNSWEGLALSIIFGVIFLGFWSILAPNRVNDGLYNAGTVQYIVSKGTLAWNSNIAYHDYPGLHIITTFIAQMIGLDVFNSITIILIAVALVLSSFLYLLFLKFFNNNPFYAVISVISLIQGTWILSRMAFFYSGYLGLTYIVDFLILLNMNEDTPLSRQHGLLVFLLLSGATITHFVTSISFFFILFGVFIEQKFDDRLFSKNINNHYQSSHGLFSLLILCLLLPLVWIISWAQNTRDFIIKSLSSFIDEFITGKPFDYLLTLWVSNLGVSIPLWVNIIHWIWLIGIYIFGTVLGIFGLINMKIMRFFPKRDVGVFVGFILLGITALFVSLRRTEAYRILMYPPLVLVPMLLWFFLNSSVRTKNYALSFLLFLLIVTSFPTFLANNNLITTQAWYSHDFAAPQFLSLSYGKGKDLTIFTGYDTTPPARYILSEGFFIRMKPLETLTDQEHVWQELDNFITRFETSVGQTQQSVLIYSERTKTPFYHTFSIKPDANEWVQLEYRLMNFNEIYDNKYEQLYALQ